MPRDPKKYLYDVHEAAKRIVRFVADKGFADYEQDELLRSAVERQFEIMGEALSQLSKVDHELAERVPECNRIIALRNVLIHGYAVIDSRLVWGVVEAKVPVLRDAVKRLLDEDDTGGPDV